VAIGRIFVSNPRIVLMDEPTASLSVKSSERILEAVEELKDAGTSVIFVSHRLPDVLRVSDRIMLLRRGRKVFLKNSGELTQDDIIRGMVAE